MISVPGPMTMVTPGWMSGLPALPMPLMRPPLSAMSALTMPQWSMISALVMTVSAQSLRHALRLPHAVANHLAAAELHFLAVDRVVLFHLRDERGIGEPHAVADRGAEHLRIGLTPDLHARLPFFAVFRAVFFRVGFPGTAAFGGFVSSRPITFALNP